MKFTLLIQFHGWWQHSGGTGHGGASDNLATRDPDGLPVLSGRTLKGLLRDAVQLVEDHQPDLAPPGTTQRLFGRRPDDPGEPADGCIRVSTASLSMESRKQLSQALRREEYTSLFEARRTTARDHTGVALDKTLRERELVLPLELMAQLETPHELAWTNEGKEYSLDSQSLDRLIADLACPLIRSIGLRRNRGTGRCSCSARRQEPDGNGRSRRVRQPNSAEECRGEAWLSLRLLEPAIFTSDGATQGAHETLDYIPGSALLGAAARLLFGELGPEAFLGGLVRFGDGLPSPRTGFVAWPIPLSWHERQIRDSYPAWQTATQPLEILPLATNRETVYSKPTSWRQLRQGYTTDQRQFAVPHRHRSFHARDRSRFGAPAEGLFFGYQFVPAGLDFLAPVRWNPTDSKAYAAVLQILAALCSTEIRLGKTRGAEFGRTHVEIANPMFQIRSQAPRKDGRWHFYCASDLCLIRNGVPVTRPTPADFGLSDNASFRPELSFLRFRSYSPRNHFHQAHLAERQLICRGSVLTFETPLADVDSEFANCSTRIREGIGFHRQEGMGDVHLNPAWLLEKRPQIHRETLSPIASSRSQLAGGGTLSEETLQLIRRRTADKTNTTFVLNQAQRLCEQWSQCESISNSQWNRLRTAIRGTEDSFQALSRTLEHQHALEVQSVRQQAPEPWSKLEPRIHEVLQLIQKPSPPAPFPEQHPWLFEWATESGRWYQEDPTVRARLLRLVIDIAVREVVRRLQQRSNREQEIPEP